MFIIYKKFCKKTKYFRKNRKFSKKYWKRGLLWLEGAPTVHKCGRRSKNAEQLRNQTDKTESEAATMDNPVEEEEPCT